MTDRELMQQALEALENVAAHYGDYWDYSITALRERLAQPEQEPVAWMIELNGEPTGNLLRDEGYATREMQRLNMLHPQDSRRLVPLYTTPPRREWQGLTEEEIEKVCVPLGAAMLSFPEVARAIEAKLKEKCK